MTAGGACLGGTGGGVKVGGADCTGGLDAGGRARGMGGGAPPGGRLIGMASMGGVAPPCRSGGGVYPDGALGAAGRVVAAGVGGAGLGATAGGSLSSSVVRRMGGAAGFGGG